MSALDWLRDDHTIALLGRRGSGKSVLIKEICWHLRDEFPLAIVMTGTKLNGWYNGWLPRSCVYSGFHESLLEKLIARQHRLITENATLPKAEQTDPRVLLILDDVISEREASGSHALQTLFVTGRHLKVCVILATQHVTSRTYPPVLRNNTDVVFCFAQSSEDAVDIVVSQWMTGAGTRREGVDRLHAVTRAARYQPRSPFEI